MHIIFTGPGGRYAAAAISKRVDGKKSNSYNYLGTVLDKESGIYKSRERGIFTFNPKTNEYGVPSDEIIAKYSSKKFKRICVDFGDSYFLNEFLYKSGIISIIDKLECPNKDTLHVMILFYMLSNLANCDANIWYSGNIVRLIYPNAKLSSQRISEFLCLIGSIENRMMYQKNYIDYILKYYNNDKNILIDSTGLPNNIKFPFTCKNVHNGKVNNEVRLIFVVQKGTGIPLFYLAIPGNIVDVSTLERIFLYLESFGINIEECILDAGYFSDLNLSLFYDKENKKKIGFIIRIKSNDKNLKNMIEEELEKLEIKDNFIKYEDRYLFIKKREVKIGKDRKNIAWLYLGLDRMRMCDEYKKLVQRAKNKKLSNEDVFNAMQTEGLFGILSNQEIPCEEILPAYYQRQAAEQIFDFSKNYTKLLPLRTYSEETFQGHLLLSYISSCCVKLIQLRLKVANLYLGSRLSFMRNQKCIINKNSIITDIPQKEVNETYKAFNIEYPTNLQIINNKLKYTPSCEDIKSILPQCTKKNKDKKVKNQEKDSSKIKDDCSKSSDVQQKTDNNSEKKCNC